MPPRRLARLLVSLPLLLAAAVASGVPPPKVAARAQLAPEVAAMQIYRDHARARTPLYGRDDRRRLDRYFEKDLADLVIADMLQATEEPGVLDGDPLYDAQDFEISNLAVRAPTWRDGYAEVVVTFDNFGESRRILLVLAPEPSRWKIHDIRYEDGRSLRDLLTQAP